MSSMERIMLTHEASAGDTHKQVSTELPGELVQCLEKNRFLHLATCIDNVPHVSLMNYTYLASSAYSSSAVIVMTANPASKKMNNVAVNPNVSILVHDWVSPMPPSHQRRLSGASSSTEQRSNSLVPLLFNMNTSAVARISATMNGTARLVPRGSDEERFYRAAHLENTGFDGAEEEEEERRSPRADVVAPELRSQVRQGGEAVGSGGRSASFVAGEDVRVVLVDIRNVRIADLDGGVRDWEILPPAGEMVNGIPATAVEVTQRERERR